MKRLFYGFVITSVFTLIFGISAFGQLLAPTSGSTATPATPVIPATPAKKPATSQSSTTVNISVDQYDWNKLAVIHNFTKEDAINFQIWHKQPTDVKRFRLTYQRKFVHAIEKTNLQFTPGAGFQLTTRKGRAMSKQFVATADFQVRHKINKDWTFNARVADFLSISPTAKQGDNTNKIVTDTGLKFQKFGFSYHAEYLAGFKAKWRENFQGGTANYDFTKRFNAGVVIYTDLKQRQKEAHIAFTASIKL